VPCGFSSLQVPASDQLLEEIFRRRSVEIIFLTLALLEQDADSRNRRRRSYTDDGSLGAFAGHGNDEIWGCAEAEAALRRVARRVLSMAAYGAR